MSTYDIQEWGFDDDDTSLDDECEFGSMDDPHDEI
jgi:hypothetical protein